MFSHNQADCDLWGHVQYGRDALNRGLPQSTTYSYTAQGFHWINHENLAEHLFAWTVDHVGVWGLNLTKCLLGLLLLGLMLWRARRSGGTWPIVVVSLLLVSSILTQYWPVRPQVISFTLFGMMIALLSFAFDGWEDGWHLPWGRTWARGEHVRMDRNRWKMRALWLMPVLFLIWANAHGAFLAGLCLYAAYLGMRGLEAISVGGRQSAGILRRFGLMLTVAILATLLNPYHAELYSWLFTSFRLPNPEITEWQPLQLSDSMFWLFGMLMVAVVLGLAFSRNTLDATQLVLLSLALWQALRIQRHVPFFAILAGFWLPAHWQSVWERFRSSDRRKEASSTISMHQAPFRKWAVGALVVVNLGLAIGLASRIRQIRVARDEYPVAAIEFIHQHKLVGRTVVTYNWAQYALAALGVQGLGEIGTTVHFDGRFNTCYPQRVIDEHFDFILGNQLVPRYRGPQSPPPRPEAALETGGPDLVLISRLQQPSVETMRSQEGDWVVLYQDALAQVWGRSSIYDEPASEKYFPIEKRRISETLQLGYVAWPALPHSVEESTVPVNATLPRMDGEPSNASPAR